MDVDRDFSDGTQKNNNKRKKEINQTSIIHMSAYQTFFKKMKSKVTEQEKNIQNSCN